MNKTWKPIIAGILEIMAGFGMLASAYFFLALLYIETPWPWPPGHFLWFFIPFLGILSVVGGVCALLRRKWGLAFAGAIATVPLFLVARFGLRVFINYPYIEPTPPIFYLYLVLPLLLSIAIITLIVLSKKEFE
jgi:hypothetical protein